MMPRGAESPTPFHRPLSIGQRYTFDRKERVAHSYAKNSCALRIGTHRSQLLLRLQHPHAELRFEKTVHRAPIRLDLGFGESLEKGGGQDDFVEHHGLAAELEHPAQDNHGIARLELEGTR